MKKLLIVVTFLSSLSACMIPGTYFDPYDDYVRGLRFFDHGKFDEARFYWEPMARKGDCDAQFRYGTLYFLGAGVPQDYEETRRWWLAAANQGQAFAQAMLAIMHAHDVASIKTVNATVWFNCKTGCGVEKDMAAAYTWLSLSEKCAVYAGQREWAGQLQDTYRPSMTAEQIAEADREVQAWKPSPSQCKQRKLD